jgi:Tol biopolymer transport system component
MNADGSNPRRLTNNAAYDSHPAWSPDGTQIAFVSERDGNREIYVLEIAAIEQRSGEPRRLTDDPAADMRPAWSPDGTQIAFNSERDGNWEIYLMGSDGENERRLTESAAWEVFPSWSPDGALLAYRYSSPKSWDGNVWIMNADGSEPRQLTDHPGNDENPSWSPDGTQIVFQSDRYADPGTTGTEHYNFELLIMDADGGNIRRLTDQPGGDYWPAWGPAMDKE